MGCGASNVSPETQKFRQNSKDGILKISSCKVIFSHRQLLKLNHKFLYFTQCDNNIDEEQQGEQNKSKDRHAAYIKEVVERLIQRLICNIGTLDPRFSSKFLINLEPLKNIKEDGKKNFKLKYLVRLDMISTPALYPEIFEPPIRIVEGTDNETLPQGYAKIRVHGEFLEQWMEFINSNGFLRRDKIQKRFVELLAKAAARPTEPLSPDEVDESRHCGSPGKIVDPVTLHYILKVPTTHQVFYGSPECNESRFPDPRDFRIAIVEGAPEARLIISFLSPMAQTMVAEDVEISITLGVGVVGWPAGSNFPSRFPLDHVDVILAYRAAQMDYYLVPKGPPLSVPCEDRSSVWEIRALATEMFLEHHYSPASVITRVYKTLILLLEVLKARGVKTINKYILKNLLFFELERKRKGLNWAPQMISRRVLSILDQLLIFLRNQMIPSYFFNDKNLLLQDNTLEEDYISDGDILEIYLKQLFNDGFKPNISEYETALVKDQLENVMLHKWDNIVSGMIPSMSNKSRRLGVVNNSPACISYTRQQLEYIAVLLKEILKLKTLQRKNTLSEIKKLSTDHEETNANEDFLYLLQIIFNQAKEKLMGTYSNRSYSKIISRKNSSKLNQIILSYDISTAMLTDDIRRHKGMDFHLVDDTSIVIKIIEYLYKAIDSDGKVLGPVLRPYLNQIFRGSHENCWFLFEWKKTMDLSEFQAIGAFSNLVLSRTIDPFDGILNSANKGWNWAKNCLSIIQAMTEENSTQIIIGKKIDSNNPGLKLIFTPSPGKTVRINVSANTRTETTSEKTPKDLLNETMNEKSNSDSRFNTIKSFKEILNSAISTENLMGEDNQQKNKEQTTIKNLKLRHEKQALHTQLKNGSPFTVASMEMRRQGNSRGLGSVVQALISLQKLSVLQEISQYLPENERSRVLGDIKKLSKEIQRLAVENYRKNRTFSFSAENRSNFKKSSSTLPIQRVHQKMKKFLPRRQSIKELPGDGVFKSVDECSTRDTKTEIFMKAKTLDKKIERIKESNLLGTCRQLRENYRPNVLESKSLTTFSNARRYNKDTSTFPKSIINTPFYIKVSSYNSKVVLDKLSN